MNFKKLMLNNIKSLLILVALSVGIQSYSQTTEEVLVKIYAEELGIIANNRIQYQCDKVGSALVDTSKVFANIANHGVLMQEYTGARSVVASNPEYTAFLSSHKLPVKEELVLFNNYVMAYLSDYVSDSQSATPLESNPAFRKPKGKQRIKSETKDPVTGGEIWTFGNGIRVLYKYADTKGSFRYNFVIRGGYAEVPDLQEGEGPYVGDMLPLYDVDGMKWYDFRRALAVRGIEMNTKVTILDMQIYGAAPTQEFETLFGAMLSVLSNRSPNPNAYEQYRSDMRRRGKNYDPMAVADSIIRPGYKYTPYRYRDDLADDFPQRVNEYLDSQLSRFNDGMIILIGDLSPYDAKKVLSKYLNSFNTGSRYAVRSPVQYIQRSGTSSNVINSRGTSDASINIVVSAQLPITSENYMALKLARIELENRLKEATKDEGVSVRTLDDIEYFPDERMSVMVSCTGYDSSIQMAIRLRNVLASVVEKNVDENALKIDKALLLSELDKWLGSPQGNMDAALMRYSEGKDHVTDYKTKVNNVKAEQVTEILRVLENTTRADLIIQ